MSKLIAICEGGIHTAEYLHRNKVYPSSLVLEPDSVQEILPYFTSEDDVLLIISGLTDFTMASVYGILNKLEENKEKVEKLTIMTNIPLGKVPYDYYLYTDDLFYGSVVKIINNKKYYLDSDGNVIEDSKKYSKIKKTQANGGNPIMLAYKKYNDRAVKVAIYGMHKKDNTNTEVAVNSRDYADKVISVDLFKN